MSQIHKTRCPLRWEILGNRHGRLFCLPCPQFGFYKLVSHNSFQNLGPWSGTPPKKWRGDARALRERVFFELFGDDAARLERGPGAKGPGASVGGLAIPAFSPPPEEGLVAEVVLVAEAGGGGWMLIKSREPVGALGLGIVLSVGHDRHHARGQGSCETWLNGALRPVPKTNKTYQFKASEVIEGSKVPRSKNC